MATDFIKEAVNSKCPLTIWDPCPQSVKWGIACVDDATLAEETRIARERESVVDSGDFMPEYYSQEAKNKCTMWRDLNQQTAPNDRAARVEALNSIPQYSSSATRFRFCIILAGPPGSGKSVMSSDEKASLTREASRMNPKAAKKPWVQLGHDQIICKISEFTTELNKGPLFPAAFNPAATTQEQVDDMQKNILINGSEWNNIMKAQNDIYNTFRGEIGDKNLLRNNIIIILKNMLLTNSHVFNSKCYSAIETDNDSVLQNLLKEFFDSLPEMSKFLEQDGEINSTEFLYIKTGLSIMYGFNITYETTLKSLASLEYLFELSSILTDQCQHFNYIFLLGFPIVAFNSLEERIMERYLSWAHKEDRIRRQICSVGIPDLTRKKFHNNMKNAYFTLASLIWFCTGAGALESCPGIGIDYLFIFDNTGALPKQYNYMIPISKRSYQIAPVGLHQQPLIRKQTKKWLVTVLMRSLNCIKGGTCGDEGKRDDGASGLQPADCWTLPLAKDMSLGTDAEGDELYLDSSQDIMTDDWESGDALSFATTDFNFKQLREALQAHPADISQENIEKLLADINVIYAYKNLLDNLNERSNITKILTALREKNSVMTKFEQLEKVYGLDSIISYLKCIHSDDGDEGKETEVISPGIGSTEITCDKQTLVPLHPAISLTSPKAVPDPLLAKIHQSPIIHLQLPGSRNPLPPGRSIFASPAAAAEANRPEGKGGQHRGYTRKKREKRKRRITRRR